MNLVLPFVVGALTAAGLYMMTRRSTMKLVIGLSLLSHASHLLVFSTGRLVRSAPPLIEEHHEVLVAPYADPLPQALVLTAIVINFGVLAFAIALVSRAYRETGIDDLDSLQNVEELR
jgi:multicomponent Na+:H+ antiporter subunit C